MKCPKCSINNPDGMRFCGNCGSPLSRGALDRERRNVSVVFVDLSGFSSLTRNWIPEQLRDLADEILTVVAGIIEDYDGYVDAFQGDGLIALFGAPRSHSDDPHRAVLAAASGLKAIETIGESKGYALKGRAGVNTGIVIAGAIGSGRVRDYTVMGSAVNLAARLEAAATPGEVWVGPGTFEATRHRMVFEPVSPVSLAGFPNITEVYKLVSLNEAATLDPYAHLEFVGREAELRTLREAFERTRQTQQTQTLWLVGEAGMGKTRLVDEVTRQLTATGEANVVWVDEQLLDIDTGWRQLCAQLFDLSLNDDARTWHARVRAQLNELLPNESRWQTYILTSLGLLETKPWRRLERRSVDRTFLAWRDLLKAYVKRSSDEEVLIFVVEHSSQTAAFSHFPDLLAETEVPLLILRTRRRRDLSGDAPQLHLSPLSLKESLALIGQVANPVLKVATESLVFQVGGIPANILELGRAMSAMPESSFSGSLASLLQARLDMLPPGSRQLLALAALTGERFWEKLITDVNGLDNAAALQELIEENLIVKESSSLIPECPEYRFQSELVRRAVLRMIPFSERPLVHLSIANWLERYAPLSLSEQVAYHFKEGGSNDAAYPHYLAAADLAVSEQDFERAYELFSELLSLELPEHLLAQGSLAYTQAAIGHGDTALALAQLAAADGWIELSSDETRGALRQVHTQLCLDVQDLEASN